jgi:dihydrodipicolinate synthase/N-acetylneuraminate lyase
LTVAVPELLVNLWDATTTGKLEEAVELQRRVIEFTAVIGDLQRTAGRAVLRESLKLRDLPVVDFPRWPTKDLSSEASGKLRNALAAATG